MLLYPAVDKLNEQVPNRYLLVNVVARKAREIADDAESLGEHLSEKPVTLAINGVAAGEVDSGRRDGRIRKNGRDRQGYRILACSGFRTEQ